MANKLYYTSLAYRDLFDSWISDIETLQESSSAYIDDLSVESLIMDNTVYSHPTCANLPKFKSADLTLDEIEITSNPYRTRYFHKDTFDKTGLEVTAKFRNNNSVVIDDYTIEPNGPLEFTDEYVTVSYTYDDTTYHATIPITVSGEPVYMITGNPCYYSDDGCEGWTSYAAYTGYKSVTRMGDLIYSCKFDDTNLYQSYDGTEWSPYRTTELSYIHGVYSGNGIGFAYGYVNNVTKKCPGIYYTTDLGRSWSIVSDSWVYSLTDDVTITNITYGDGKFIAVTNNTYILSSNDGKTWSICASFDDTKFDNIIYANDMFIASGNKSYYSYDSSTWTLLPGVIYDNGIHAVAYGNGRFVGVGDYGRYYYYEPSTMTEWGTGTCQNWISTQCNGIVFYESIFIAVTFIGDLMETSDGKSWSWMSYVPRNKYYGIYKI